MNENELAQCYKLLELEPGASVIEIDAAYSKKIFEKLRQGAKAEKQMLEAAYETLKNHTLLQAYDQAQESNNANTLHSRIIDCINECLNTKRINPKQINVQIRLHEEELQIFLKAKQVPNANLAGAIYHNLIKLELPDTKIIKVYGMRGNQSIVWKQQFQVSTRDATSDSDPYSFKNRNINILAFPVALVFGVITTPLKFLFFSTHTWIHEFGHATVAWLAGHNATPLPFGWTNVGESRSLFVYFGILVLLGLLFRTGWLERKMWVMGLAIGFAILQFCMTWIVPSDIYEMWLAFGGIGGEFCLSTLLMISFYFPLPERWRWDFWRYIVILGAANTFWWSFSQWHQISKGEESIPWGSLFGGEGDAGGDMNQLSLVYGWSDQQIINTYNQLGNVCLLVLVAVYGFILIRDNQQFSLWFRHKKWKF
jgi:hypothetical protein